MRQVEPAAALAHERDHRAVRLEIGRIGGDEVPADLRRDLPAAGGVDVGDDDLRSGRRERQRGRAPEPARTACDERYAIAQRRQVDGSAEYAGHGAYSLIVETGRCAGTECAGTDGEQ